MVLNVDAARTYLAHWLPGTLIVSLGIGLDLHGTQRLPRCRRCRRGRFAVEQHAVDRSRPADRRARSGRTRC